MITGDREPSRRHDDHWAVRTRSAGEHRGSEHELGEPPGATPTEDEHARRRELIEQDMNPWSLVGDCLDVERRPRVAYVLASLVDDVCSHGLRGDGHPPGSDRHVRNVLLVDMHQPQAPMAVLSDLG